MNTQYIIFGIIGLLVVIVIFVIAKDKKKTVIPIENIDSSYYYRYGGEIAWIKGKLEKYKFKSLASMLICRNAEEADFKIDIIIKDSGQKVMNVYATEFDYGKFSKMECLISELKLTEEQYKDFVANTRGTYSISGTDANKKVIKGKKKGASIIDPIDIERLKATDIRSSDIKDEVPEEDEINSNDVINEDQNNKNNDPDKSDESVDTSDNETEEIEIKRDTKVRNRNKKR